MVPLGLQTSAHDEDLVARFKAVMSKAEVLETLELAMIWSHRVD
jgi:hypothetical protein